MKTIDASLNWLSQFPPLAAIDDAISRKLLAAAHNIHIKKNARVFQEGMPCERYLLVLTGSIRVQKVTPGGHEIVLYHIGPGQACELTTACIIGGHNYPAEAIAETAVQAVSIARDDFNHLLSHCPPFRALVYQHVERGLTDLVTLVEQVAFGHMDARLAQCLLKQENNENKVAMTHQELAAELGSAREVVSRLLKEFERHGWVKLHRGHIDIINTEALKRLSNKTFE